MPKTWNRYLAMWERYWANGNYPLNGHLSSDDKRKIKKIFLRLNAEHAVRKYKKYANQIKILGEN